MRVDLQIDHVQVAAPEGREHAARQFFGELLELKERPKVGAPSTRGGCWFHVGTQEIHIGVVPDFVPAKKAHVALRLQTVGALETLSTRLEGAGHPVQWDDGLPGISRLFTTDPWGNRVEFLAHQEPPHA